MSGLLKRTGKKIKFFDLNIGNPFFAHGVFWVRTSYDAATSLANSGDRGPMGCCNFTTDPEDRYVEAVELQIGNGVENDPTSRAR